MPPSRTNDDLYIDANGCLAERISAPGGMEVIIHYDDIPESDITTVNGIRCTTALRTVIDLAAEHDRAEMEHMVRSGLQRQLFSRYEAMARISQPDMATRPGARVLRQILANIAG